MHGYYAEQDVLPTFGDFRSEADLDRHEAARRRLFTDRLSLPPRLFEGARLLEFGPDAGENSLVFARWGADCTLAEPHVRAHETISAYFSRFGLGDRLVALEACDVESYPEGELFDIIDAEGFVNAIQPPGVWIDKFARLLRPEGLLVVFYMEAFGSLLELTWKFVHARYRALTGLDSTDAVRAVFGTKWDSIPHKRAIESWAMDVLENPFVRLEYFLEPGDLCAQADGAGLRLHTSWPRYDGGLDVHWFKTEPTSQEQLERQLDFIRRSRLSTTFGRKHFLAGPDEGLDEDLRGLLADFDSLVDGFDPEAAVRCKRVLSRVAEVLRSPVVLSSDSDRERSLATVDMLGRLLDVLGGEDAGALATFANTDESFIGSWGMPSHFAVFRRDVQPS